jgi:hypothetical protein
VHRVFGFLGVVLLSAAFAVKDEGACMSNVAVHEHNMDAEMAIRQEQGFQQLLILHQQLQHPEFAEAVRGLGGILKADRLLKEKNEVGVLVGGLSEEILHKDATLGTLSAHKDVDVMVLTPASTFKNFEGGIDWWLHHDFNLEWRRPNRPPHPFQVPAWVNGFDMVLGITIDIERGQARHSARPGDFEAGLYFLDVADVVSMRSLETQVAGAAKRDSMIFEGNALAKFEEKLAASLGPQFVRELTEQFPAFEQRVLSTRLALEGVRLRAHIRHQENGNLETIRRQIEMRGR